VQPPPREPSNSGADERSPIRRSADLPTTDGEALVEHLAERAARAERELRLARATTVAQERDRALLTQATRLLVHRPGLPVADLAQPFLPALGRWCIVDEIPKGEPTRSVVAIDEVVARDAAPLAGPFRLRGQSPIGLGRTMRSGRVERLAARPSLDDDRAGDDSETAAAIERLATGPLLIVPVTARDRNVAAMTFGRGADEPEYDEADQRLATELAQLATLAIEQRRSAEAAASAAQTKAQFLTMMSHELRTPLNAIAGYAQLLEMGFRGPLNESQREAVERILRGQEHLLELVDAVLTFSRLTSGKLVLETSAVSAATLLDNASEQMAPQFSAHGIAFDVAQCPDDVLVCADADRALEVLRHLLGNALKFTRRGGAVTLGCEADAGAVRFVVSDSGRGIPASQRESIFQPFVQVEKGFTRSVDGSGLGLAVGRELAERMGGTLTVSSTEGVGSRFVLTLPRRLPEPDAISIDSPMGES
jgi:signal transduction histidine kinase